MPEVGLRRRVETRLDPATAGWAVGRPSGEPVMRAWVRLTDGSAPDPFTLLLFADVLPPTGWSIGLMGWAPTVQLQVLVRALPAPGWCLVEAVGQRGRRRLARRGLPDLGLHRPAGRAEPATRPRPPLSGSRCRAGRRPR